MGEQSGCSIGRIDMARGSSNRMSGIGSAGSRIGGAGKRLQDGRDRGTFGKMGGIGDVGRSDTAATG